MNDSEKVKNSKKISEPADKLAARFQRELQAASARLQFISETDAEVIPFIAEKPTSPATQHYLAALRITSKEIDERIFEDFFDRLTTEKDWYGPKEKERMKRWSKLRSVLENNLDHLRVIRVGRVDLDIFVAGIDSSGKLAGVKTKAIET